MATKTINAELLAKMFLAGAANLEAKKEFINELNVFPCTGWRYRNEYDFDASCQLQRKSAPWRDRIWNLWQKRFLPVLFEEPEETRE